MASGVFLIGQIKREKGRPLRPRRPGARPQRADLRACVTVDWGGYPRPIFPITRYKSAQKKKTSCSKIRGLSWVS